MCAGYHLPPDQRVTSVSQEIRIHIQCSRLLEAESKFGIKKKKKKGTYAVRVFSCVPLLMSQSQFFSSLCG